MPMFSVIVTVKKHIDVHFVIVKEHIDVHFVIVKEHIDVHCHCDSEETYRWKL